VFGEAEDSGSGLDWSCPIARRGIVAGGGPKRKRPESEDGQVELGEPPQARMRIRDSISSNHIFPRQGARKCVPVPPPPKPYARSAHEADQTHPPHGQYWQGTPARATSYAYPPPLQPTGPDYHHQGNNYSYEASFPQEPRQQYSQTGNGILAAALAMATARANNEPLDMIDEDYEFYGDTDRSCQEVHASSFCDHQTSLRGDTSKESTQSLHSGFPVTKLFSDGIGETVDEVEFFEQQTHERHINNHVTSSSWEMENFLDMQDPGLSSSLGVARAQTSNYQYPQYTTRFEPLSSAMYDPSHQQFGSMPKSTGGTMPPSAAISHGILPQSKPLAIMPSESLVSRSRRSQQGGLISSQSRTTDLNGSYKESERNVHCYGSLSDVFDLDHESAYREGVLESNHKAAVPKAISTPFGRSPSVASSIHLSPCSVPNESVVDYGDLDGSHFLMQQKSQFSANSGAKECNSHSLRQAGTCIDCPPPQAASFPPIEQSHYEPDDYEREMPLNEYGERF
jgi:hypothetical protein